MVKTLSYKYIYSRKIFDSISIFNYYFFFYHVAHFKNNNTYSHQMKIHVITHFLISNDIHCNFGQCYEKDVNIYIGLQTQGNQSLVVQYRFCLAVVFFDQGV